MMENWEWKNVNFDSIGNTNQYILFKIFNFKGTNRHRHLPLFYTLINLILILKYIHFKTLILRHHLSFVG